MIGKKLEKNDYIEIKNCVRDLIKISKYRGSCNRETWFTIVFFSKLLADDNTEHFLMKYCYEKKILDNNFETRKETKKDVGRDGRPYDFLLRRWDKKNCANN